jgi:hypothetical protein
MAKQPETKHGIFSRPLLAILDEIEVATPLIPVEIDKLIVARRTHASTKVV